MRCEHTRRRTVKAIGTLVVGASLAGCRSEGGADGDSNSADGDSNSADGDDSNSADGDDSGGDNNRSGIDETIEMTDALEFEPADLNVEAGETVAWENVGSATHTVTAFEDRIPADAAYFASGGADSEQAARDSYPPEGGIESGESYEHTFETTGTYEYACLPHEENGMTGTIFVFERGSHGHPAEGPMGSVREP